MLFLLIIYLKVNYEVMSCDIFFFLQFLICIFFMFKRQWWMYRLPNPLIIIPVVLVLILFKMPCLVIAKLVPLVLSKQSQPNAFQVSWSLRKVTSSRSWIIMQKDIIVEIFEVTSFLFNSFMQDVYMTLKSTLVCMNPLLPLATHLVTWTLVSMSVNAVTQSVLWMNVRMELRASILEHRTCKNFNLTDLFWFKKKKTWTNTLLFKTNLKLWRSFFNDSTYIASNALDICANNNEKLW